MTFVFTCLFLFSLFEEKKKKTLETYEASARLAFLQQIFLACHKSESTGGFRDIGAESVCRKAGLAIHYQACDLRS